MVHPADPPPSRASIERHVTPLGDCDPYAWLAAASSGTRRAIFARDGGDIACGVGIALALDGPNFDVLARLPVDPSPGPDGGLAAFLTARFDLDATPSNEWRPYGAVRLVVPEREVRRRHGRWWAIEHRVVPSAVAPRVARGADDDREVDVASERRRFSASIERLLVVIDDGRLVKGVLARRDVHRHGGPIDPIDLLRRVDRGSGYRFLVEAAPGESFVGASPERLVRRHGDHAWSEALAGTLAATGDDAEVARLLGSEKDRREHAIVVAHVLDRMAPFATRIASDPTPEAHRSGSLWHLRTVVTAALRPGVRDEALLAALHPTPAVAGHPVDRALSWLRAEEGFDRGLYAGLVGRVGADGLDVAVALRSVRIRDDQAVAYAGAGVVRGSVAAAEWDETERKLATAREALASIRRSDA